mgnify:CR=1 FL=1
MYKILLKTDQGISTWSSSNDLELAKGAGISLHKWFKKCWPTVDFLVKIEGEGVALDLID